MSENEMTDGCGESVANHGRWRCRFAIQTQCKLRTTLKGIANQHSVDSMRIEFIFIYVFLDAYVFERKIC